jgi:hypothetical protein
MRPSHCIGVRVRIRVPVPVGISRRFGSAVLPLVRAGEAKQSQPYQRAYFDLQVGSSLRHVKRRLQASFAGFAALRDVGISFVL